MLTDIRQWDRGPIQGLGWSEDEKLVVVVRDGTVRIYSDLDTDFQPVTLGHVSRQTDHEISMPC